MFALIIVYHTDRPSGPIVIPKGSLFLTRLPSVITPSGVILATLPVRVCVNHTLPSGAADDILGPGVGGERIELRHLVVDGSR